MSRRAGHRLPSSLRLYCKGKATWVLGISKTFLTIKTVKFLENSRKFAVLESLFEPWRSHYSPVNKKKKKCSFLVIYPSDRVNDTGRHAHWLIKLNCKTQLEVNFLWYVLRHLVMTVFVSLEFSPDLKLHWSFSSNLKIWRHFHATLSLPELCGCNSSHLL